MSVGTKLLQAAAGGASDPVYVDDVFSTTLYTGTDGSVVVPTGLDLADKGGMIWGKSRSGVQNHRIYDSGRGTQYSLIPNATSAQSDQGTQTFGSSSVTLGAASGIVGSSSYGGPDYVLWSFAKQEKFFDIVTYTGDGTTSHTINHNLGSVPGMIIVKRTDASANWNVWHRSSPVGGNGKYNDLMLNHDNAAGNSDFWPTAPTSTQFFLGDSDSAINASGGTYVAYLFGHNEAEYGQNSDEAIIYCGNYTGSGSTGKFVDLGFEPQWVLVKNTDAGTPWVLIDTMRGMPVDGTGPRLLADQEAAEVSDASFFAPRATGMEVTKQNTYVNTSGQNYVYMAIRRPNKPASEFAATDVFKPQVLSAGEGSDTFISTGFPVDAVLYTKRTSNAANVLGTRLTGGQKTGGDLKTDSNDAEGTNSGAFFLDHNNGVTVDFAGGHFNVAPAATDTDYARYYFRRMRGFFDIVTYTSNTTYPNTFAHNLGVVPELVIVKARDRTGGWTVYAAPSGNNRHLTLNSTAAESSAGSTYWNSTTPTDSVVHVGGQDETWGYNGYKYIALLFASASGISKVGSYSGTGSSQNIDCGFSNGARFVLIKNKNNAGGWYFWDSERGITTNNDPFLRLGANDGDQNYTGDDIDPHSSGFNVSSNNNAVNKSGRDYLFLAIAQDYQL